MKDPENKPPQNNNEIARKEICLKKNETESHNISFL